MNQQKKNIALLGGSFNPPHTGHFEMAKYVYETLNVDEVWFLFSENWQKEQSNYAPLHHRIEMGKILSQKYRDIPLVLSDIQSKIGTHITYDVLSELKKQYPNSKFVWVMGADNLATFHTWHHFNELINEFPIAVIDRPTYTKSALKSETANKYKHLQIDDPTDIINRKNGWCLLKNPKIDISSSNTLRNLKDNDMITCPKMQDIATYINAHNLYHN